MGTLPILMDITGRLHGVRVDSSTPTVQSFLSFKSEMRPFAGEVSCPAVAPLIPYALLLLMPVLALSYQYGGIPSNRQAIIGAIVFFLTYLTPLVIALVVLHRLPQRVRTWFDVSLAAIFTLLAIMVPGGLLAEGTALLFAVVSVAVSIDLMHLGRKARSFGLFTLALSSLILLLATGPAFVHALRSSYRY